MHVFQRRVRVSVTGIGGLLRLREELPVLSHPPISKTWAVRNEERPSRQDHKGEYGPNLRSTYGITFYAALGYPAERRALIKSVV